MRISANLANLTLAPIDRDCGSDEITEQKPGHSGGIWDRWPSGCAKRPRRLIIGDQIRAKRDNKLSYRRIVWIAEM
ncbi:unnamed protein product [Lasius platythorax]|uniref:Uncharacterized protein n=1 Tax=Lasius platythorax TaxID=488582 RepID=A0AAV2N289_9HYME